MISEFQKVSFPIEKHHFLQSGKRVQQTMVLDSPNALSTYFSSEFRFIFIVFINDFIMISGLQDNKFTNWETLLFAKW